ncbi:hypothetical protein [Actinomycetospora aeridis]|uniref:Uncharacterized protein n=1 Tax=Actinomycetospora aeridis TaxID=3129231 RepID=A0ABU8N7I6_9PSEU
MTSGRSWLAVVALLVALPLGPATTDPPPAPTGEIVVGTVGGDGEPRVLPAPGRTRPYPWPELERGTVPDSPA